jgi:hypothetical protein
MSASSNSATVITPGACSSTTSTIVVSRTAVVGGFIGLDFSAKAFFALARLARSVWRTNGRFVITLRVLELRPPDIQHFTFSAAG